MSTNDAIVFYLLIAAIAVSTLSLLQKKGSWANDPWHLPVLVAVAWNVKQSSE